MTNFIPVTIHAIRDNRSYTVSHVDVAVVAADWIAFAHPAKVEELGGRQVVWLHLRDGTALFVEPTTELLTALNLKLPKT